MYSQRRGQLNTATFITQIHPSGNAGMRVDPGNPPVHGFVVTGVDRHVAWRIP